ncbi:MAG: hypothetical protein VX228_09650 [Pseudomonadota bacterium]|nr:hypothetical protein [Pseudomonadota bacterium]
MDKADPILKAFANAELVAPLNEPDDQFLTIGLESHDAGGAALGAEFEGADSEKMNAITPLGHDGGQYYLIAPSGQLRKFSAEALEAGRGVRALFIGSNPEIENWCHAMFAARDNGWCPKKAGLWIIEQCNAKGVFDRSRTDLRSIGVWRDEKAGAVSHCGDRIIFPDGQTFTLTDQPTKHIMVGAAPITTPDLNRLPLDTIKSLLHDIQRLWGWKRPEDAEIWLGWIAAACLGGFPDWRAHLYVHGSRGSGKSKLIELAACLIGDLAGEVVNDATEAGIRQSRNDQARPLLVDEFEPEENPRHASRQGNMLASTNWLPHSNSIGPARPALHCLPRSTCRSCSVRPA